MTEPICPRCGSTNRVEARFCRGCGTELTESDAVAVAGSGPDAATVDTETTTQPADDQTANDRQRLARRLLIVAIAVVALVGAYGGFVAVRDTLYPPDKPVRALFTALAARDTEAIDEIIGCDSPLCGPGSLQSGYVPPENFEVLHVENLSFTGNDPTRRPNTSLAVVSIRYSLAGVAYTTEVNVARSSRGLWRSWKIASLPGAKVSVISLTMAKVRLGNAEIATNRPTGAGLKAPDAPFALPGIYTLTSADDPMLTATTDTIVVADDVAEQRVDLKVTLKPNVVAEVDKQIRARVDACVPQSTFRPKVGDSILNNCYFDHNTKYTYTDKARWTLVDYPKVELRIAEDRTAGTGGVSVHTVSPGHATVSYEYSFDVLEPRRWTPTAATEEINPRGSVVVADGKIAWTG